MDNVDHADISASIIGEDTEDLLRRNRDLQQRLLKQTVRMASMQATLDAHDLAYSRATSTLTTTSSSSSRSSTPFAQSARVAARELQSYLDGTDEYDRYLRQTIDDYEVEAEVLRGQLRKQDTLIETLRTRERAQAHVLSAQQRLLDTMISRHKALQERVKRMGGEGGGRVKTVRSTVGRRRTLSRLVMGGVRRAS